MVKAIAKKPVPKSKKSVKGKAQEPTKKAVKPVTVERKKPKTVTRKTEVVYDTVGVTLHTADSEEGELNVEQAMDLLGWSEESENIKFDDLFLFKYDKRKIRCLNNLTNRPYRSSLMKKYMSEILRRKWKMNGETIIIDEKGMVQSGQHRLIGLIFAELARQEDPKKWAKYWKVPITIPALIVTGIDSSPETVDTIDQGAKRNHGDVFYRDRKFEEVSDRDQAKMARILSYAVRLVWLRAGGLTVSYAPDFPVSESKEFSDNHPRILECVEHIWALEGGRKLKNISTYVSMGYAAGLMYLMGAGTTDFNSYDEAHPRTEEGISFDLFELAEKFWEIFIIKGSPLEVLRKRLVNISAGGSQGRDEICGTIIKAWHKFSDDPTYTLTAEDIQLRTVEDPDTGAVEIDETPRIGGIDVEREREDSDGE